MILGFLVADTTHSELEERWFSIGLASTDGHGDSPLLGKPMTNQSIEMPEEIDFPKAVRGRHHIPAEASLFLPAFIERSVWEYFSDKAGQKGVGLSQLLTDVLKRDIEINEAFEIARAKDPVIASPTGKAPLPNLKRQVIIEGAGHYIQQERPNEVNAALIEFLATFAGR